MSGAPAVLTLDLGTSASKAALWRGTDLVALARAPIATDHPGPGRAEQDPLEWWSSVEDASAQVREREPEWFDTVELIGLTGARQTFALFDERLEPLGPGIVWSDRRAGEEATGLGEPVEFRDATGVVLDAAACVAKVVWVAAHDAEAFARARWILAPRDYVFARLTGVVSTDPSLASRTGLYALDGAVRTSAEVARRLPPVVPSTEAVAANGALGVDAAVGVVLGAGDRPCEVLGSGSDDRNPMVSWGTTTNLSIPNPGPIEMLPRVASASVGACGGFVVEAGLSAGGAAIAWLGRVTGQRHDTLLDAATAVEPGARGVLAFAWLHGARAPWWRPEAHAAFVGLTDAHGPAEMARAIVESVALDVARCLDLLGVEARGLMLAGGGARHTVWREVLAATTACAVVRRRHDDAASVGARLVAAAARDESLDVRQVNPVVDATDADPDLIARYRELRVVSDRDAAAILGLIGQ